LLMRTIAILGATGSIGTQALDIARRYPDSFYPVCVTARNSAEKLFDIAREFKPKFAALDIEPDEIPDDLKNIEWVFGENSSAQALEMSGAQDALCAIVGIAGLSACWKALDVCERVLLANKEALVTGGDLVMEKSRRLNKPILPVDSEHSAIFQCLRAAEGNPVHRLILTASGGALRDMPLDMVKNATVRDVLKHPTWSMGAKITVDCATMLNKGLEVIEAHHLFGMPRSKIDVVIHPQSVIHSMIEFEDGAVLAQIGAPDMRGPISYAMGYPKRLPYEAKRLDFAALSQVTFMKPDMERYPCLKLSLDALDSGAAACVALNAANEVAVAKFLKGECGVTDIPHTIERTLSRAEMKNIESIDDVFYLDARAREIAAIGG